MFGSRGGPPGDGNAAQKGDWTALDVDVQKPEPVNVSVVENVQANAAVAGARMPMPTSTKTLKYVSSTPQLFIQEWLILLQIIAVVRPVLDSQQLHQLKIAVIMLLMTSLQNVKLHKKVQNTGFDAPFYLRSLCINRQNRLNY